jgi:kinesin family protein 4/21/27
MLRDFWFSGARGVSLDKTTKPPQLFGQEEVPIRTLEDILGLFGAIASRNTAATGMNDSSSRSHCFVFLNLYAFDPSTERIRHSRFQFVDLAGSERMKDAHGTSSWMDAMKAGNTGAIEGVMTNFGLMMLSQRVRELAAARGKRRELLVERSFKTQGDPDLLPLISESLTGSALSLLVVCVSCAPDNASQSVNALGFGKEFSRLSVRPRQARELRVAKWRQQAESLLASGRGGSRGGNPKYAILRAAKGRAGEQLNELLQRLTGGRGEGGGGAARRRRKK